MTRHYSAEILRNGGKKVRVLFVYRELIAGDLAYILKLEGCNVKLFIEDRGQKNCFDGLVKKTNNWNEKLVVENIKAILNEFMGEPPAIFILNDKEYTPLQYFNDYLNLKINNYFSFISQKSSNYFEKAE